MNCCDANGECRQSDDCPVRTGVVLPHQCAHDRRVARIKSSTPKFATPTPPAPPPGRTPRNFKIVDLGPDDDDGQPLTHDESMALVRTLLLWLLAVVFTVAAVSVAVGYGTERWADVLWAYLSRMS